VKDTLYFVPQFEMEVKWNKLDVKLSASTKKTIQEMGFKTMTPVQVRL
jgi:superfamily II DNA/RNA helicase